MSHVFPHFCAIVRKAATAAKAVAAAVVPSGKPESAADTGTGIHGLFQSLEKLQPLRRSPDSARVRTSLKKKSKRKLFDSCFMIDRIINLLPLYAWERQVPHRDIQ